MIHPLYYLDDDSPCFFLRESALSGDEGREITSIAVLKDQIIRSLGLHSVNHAHYVWVIRFVQNQYLILNVLELVVTDTVPFEAFDSDKLVSLDVFPLKDLSIMSVAYLSV
jgi:hypothetical protein